MELNACKSPGDVEAGSTQPNILLILTGDRGWPTLGSTDQNRSPTVLLLYPDSWLHWLTVLPRYEIAIRSIRSFL